ncbi:MAG: putative LPS assembly protein LptD, partial [Gemmatimonadota bacterium]
SLSDLETTLQDSVFMDLPSTTQTTYTWNTSADFHVDLVGSTVLRPQVRAEGALFRSADTGGDFESAPTRAMFGATLSTDLYGFFPGFAGFTRVRHKISPGFNWSYSPAVELDPALAAIPGFPTTAGAARNELSITLNQTFEAKLPSAQAEADSAGLEAAETDSLAARLEPGPLGARPSPTQRGRDETITLLGIRTSGLRFDFERAKIGEPVLVSESITNSLSSDLLRGLTINMTHDLFNGTGSTRDFSPFLQRLTASFSFRGGAGGDVFGMRDRSASRPRPATTSARDRFRDEEIYGIDDPFGETGAGPWSLSVTYSLLRVRPEEFGTDSQSLNATLSLRPTSNWSVRWRSQYNFSEKEFGQNVISLDRDLHRWLASFQFARSPNGNTIFQVSVSLQDAPEIRGDYIQRTD